MKGAKSPRMLFAAHMAGGVRTILQDLRELIGPRTDVDSAFVPVEMDQESQVLGKVRKRSLIPGSIRNSAVTASRIREFEAAGGPLGAELIRRVHRGAYQLLPQSISATPSFTWSPGRSDEAGRSQPGTGGGSVSVPSPVGTAGAGARRRSGIA